MQKECTCAEARGRAGQRPAAFPGSPSIGQPSSATSWGRLTREPVSLLPAPARAGSAVARRAGRGSSRGRRGPEPGGPAPARPVLSREASGTQALACEHRTALPQGVRCVNKIVVNRVASVRCTNPHGGFSGGGKSLFFFAGNTRTPTPSLTSLLISGSCNLFQSHSLECLPPACLFGDDLFRSCNPTFPTRWNC